MALKLTKKERRIVRKALRLIANKKEYACCLAFSTAANEGWKTYPIKQRICNKFHKFYNQQQGRGYWLRMLDDDDENRNTRVLWLLLFLKAG